MYRVYPALDPVGAEAEAAADGGTPCRQQKGTTMKILNVPLGLATNSSSTHSIVFLPRGVRARPVDPRDGSQCYGWDCFQLVDPDRKRDYADSPGLPIPDVADVGALYRDLPRSS